MRGRSGERAIISVEKVCYLTAVVRGYPHGSHSAFISWIHCLPSSLLTTMPFISNPTRQAEPTQHNGNFFSNLNHPVINGGNFMSVNHSICRTWWISFPMQKPVLICVNWCWNTPRSKPPGYTERTVGPNLSWIQSANWYASFYMSGLSDEVLFGRTLAIMAKSIALCPTA